MEDSALLYKIAFTFAMERERERKRESSFCGLGKEGKRENFRCHGGKE